MYDIDPFMTQQISDVDELISLLKIDLPDEFYSLPERERTKKLNEMFPTWLASLSADKKSRIHELLEPAVKARMRKTEASIVQRLVNGIQFDHAAELSSTIKFTSPQEQKLDGLREKSTKASPTTTHEG